MTWRLNDSHSNGSYRRWLPVLLLAGGMISAVGCGGGDSGPKRYNLSGTVNFDGKPIPAGTIVFQPDAAKGNSGPQGIAMIRDGNYDTAAEGGKGTIGGPHIVRISGFEGVAESEDDVVQELFAEFELEADLPKEKGSQDFEVPADAPKAAKVTGGGPA